MLLWLFGMFDMVVGGSLLFADSLSATVLFWIGALVLIKGLTSVGGAALQKYFLDWMGWLDIIAGVALLLHWSVPLLWIIIIAKGLWSFFAGLNR
jgi:hypothetical protein